MKTLRQNMQKGSESINLRNITENDMAEHIVTLSSLKENAGRIILEDLRTKFNYWLLYGDFTATGELIDVI